MSPSVADPEIMSVSMRHSPLDYQAGRAGCLLRVNSRAAAPMASSARDLPLIVHWKLSWPRAILQISRIHGGMPGFGLGLDRGNELAQGQRGLVDLVGGGVPACRLSRARREGCESCFRASDGRSFGR